MTMAIFRDGYEEVIRRLGRTACSSCAYGTRSGRLRTTGAICQARSRLGEESVRVLSGRIAVPLADPGAPDAWLGQRRLMACTPAHSARKKSSACVSPTAACPATAGEADPDPGRTPHRQGVDWHQIQP
jgi:hypothetical protein